MINKNTIKIGVYLRIRPLLVTEKDQKCILSTQNNVQFLLNHRTPLWYSTMNTGSMQHNLITSLMR